MPVNLPPSLPLLVNLFSVKVLLVTFKWAKFPSSPSDETLSAAAASAEKERATREQYAEVAANAAALQTQVGNEIFGYGKV